MSVYFSLKLLFVGEVSRGDNCLGTRTVILLVVHVLLFVPGVVFVCDLAINRG